MYQVMTKNVSQLPKSLDVPIAKMMLSGDFEKLITTIKTETGISLPESITVKEMQFLAQKGLFTHQQLRDFTSSVKEQSTYATIAKGLLMTEGTLEDVSELRNYFTKLHDKVTSLIESSENLLGAENSVAKEAGNVKASVEFMNVMNQDFNMIHLPMLLGDKLLNSEFYVMNDKSAMKKDSDTITALVRLDLLNLGHTDIYVKKTAKNVDVKFYMTDQDQIQVMKDHVYKLHKMLNEKGFNIMGASVLPLEEAFDVTKDFLDEDGKKMELKRYTFDMRA